VSTSGPVIERRTPIDAVTARGFGRNPVRRCDVIKRIGLALWLGSAVALAVGAVGSAPLVAVVERTWPVLLFALSITLVADNAARAGVFTSVAESLAHLASGRRRLLFAMVIALAVVCTTFLSLDTTAVLLTPVMVLLARRTQSAVRPFALATVWIANTASLTLPVSNLTNLLAAHRLGEPSPLAWLRVMAIPSLAAIAVTAIALAIVGGKSLRGRYKPTNASIAPDRSLWRAAVIVLALLVPALVLPVAPWIPATAAAVALIVVAKVRKHAGAPYRTWWRDAPWSLLVFASGLFMAGGILEATLLPRLELPSLPAGVGGVFAASAVGLVAANLFDNLPAYLGLESLTQVDMHLRAVLIGVNVGPLITPWGSLATLLWHRQLTALDVEVSWRRFALWGLALAPAAVLVAAGALSFAG